MADFTAKATGETPGIGSTTTFSSGSFASTTDGILYVSILTRATTPLDPTFAGHGLTSGDFTLVGTATYTDNEGHNNRHSVYWAKVVTGQTDTIDATWATNSRGVMTVAEATGVPSGEEVVQSATFVGDGVTPWSIDLPGALAASDNHVFCSASNGVNKQFTMNNVNGVPTQLNEADHSVLNEYVTDGVTVTSTDDQNPTTEWAVTGGAAFTDYSAVSFEIGAGGAAGVTGTLTSTLDDVTSDISATVPVTGTMTSTLDDVVSDITGTISVEGDLTSTLDDVVSDITGTVAGGVTGTLTSTLDDITSDITGTVTVESVLTSTLDDVVSDVNGVVAVKGALATAIGDIISDITGIIPVSGTMNSVLDNVGSSIIALISTKYYVDPVSGNDANDGLSPGNAKEHIEDAVQLTIPGDQVILLDGTYPAVAANDITGTLLTTNSGTADHYCELKADNFGQVIIEAAFDTGVTSGSVYWRFEGIEWRSTVDKGTELSHLKFFLCSFYGGATGAASSPKVWAIGSATDHLYEMCIFYGPGGRYAFQAFTFDRVILRYCVIRADGGWDGDGQHPEAPHIFYGCNDAYAFNCVVIDSVKNSDPGTDEIGAFSAVNNPDSQASDSVHFRGCIAYNNEYPGVSMEGTVEPATDWLVQQCSLMANIDAVVMDRNSSSPTNQISWLRNIFSINTDNGATLTNSANYTGDVDQNIVLNNVSTALNDSSTGSLLNGDNNLVFGNTSNPQEFDSVFPTNLKTYDPLMLYPLRVEVGTQADTDDVGPPGVETSNELLYQIGAIGTMFGETGWDTLQAVSVWTGGFGNNVVDGYEDWVRTRFKTVVAAGSGTGATEDGNRGFCDDTLDAFGRTPTLSSYIWQAYGNERPAFIYGDVTGTLTSTLDDVTSNIVGSVGGGVGGTLTSTLDDVTSDISALVGAGRFAQLPAGDAVETSDQLTGSHTLVAGLNRMLVVAVVVGEDNAELPRAITNITYSGVPLVFVDDLVQSGSPSNNKISIYQLLELDLPADGANTLVIDWASGVFEAVRKAFIYQMDDRKQITTITKDSDFVSDLSITYAGATANSEYITIGVASDSVPYSITPSGFADNNELDVSNPSTVMYAGSSPDADSSPAVYSSFITLVGYVIEVQGLPPGGVNGHIATTLDNVTSDITGTAAVKGTLAPTLDGVTSDLTGTLTVDGSLTPTLDDAVSNLSGTVAVKGTLTSTLDNITSDLIGTVETNITGTLTSTLGDVVSDLTGNVELVGVVGTLTSTLDDVTSNIIADVDRIAEFSTFPEGDAINTSSDEILGEYSLLPGTDRALVMIVVEETSPAPFAPITSITFGGVAASFVNNTEQQNGGGTRTNRVQTYQILEADLPADGLQQIDIDWAAGALSFSRKVYVWQFSSVDQVTPLTVTSDIVDANPASISIPYAENPVDGYVTAISEGNGGAVTATPTGFLEQNRTEVFGTTTFWAGAAFGPGNSPADYTVNPSNRLAGVVVKANIFKSVIPVISLTGAFNKTVPLTGSS